MDPYEWLPQVKSLVYKKPVLALSAMGIEPYIIWNTTEDLNGILSLKTFMRMFSNGSK